MHGYMSVYGCVCMKMCAVSVHVRIGVGAGKFVSVISCVKPVNEHHKLLCSSQGSSGGSGIFGLL